MPRHPKPRFPSSLPALLPNNLHKETSPGACIHDKINKFCVIVLRTDGGADDIAVARDAGTEEGFAQLLDDLVAHLVRRNANSYLLTLPSLFGPARKM